MGTARHDHAAGGVPKVQESILEPGTTETEDVMRQGTAKPSVAERD